MNWQKRCEELNAKLQDTKKLLRAQNAQLSEIRLGSTDAITCPGVVTNYLRDLAGYISVWLHSPKLMRAVAETILEDNVSGPVRQEMDRRSPRTWETKQQVHWDLCVAVRRALMESAKALEEEEENDGD